MEEDVNEEEVEEEDSTEEEDSFEEERDIALVPKVMEGRLIGD